MLIGKRMKLIRQKAGKSLSDIARDTKINIQILSAIERNQNHPDLGKMYAIANALDTTVEALIKEPSKVTGLDTCHYCGVSYHPMMRFSNSAQVICVCDPAIRRIAKLGDDPGCQKKAEQDGYYARPSMTPKR